MNVEMRRGPPAHDRRGLDYSHDRDTASHDSADRFHSIGLVARCLPRKRMHSPDKSLRRDCSWCWYMLHEAVTR
jgi:hypothetical protein